MPKFAVLAEGLSKRFPRDTGRILRRWLGRSGDLPAFTALDAVSIQVPKGEMLGVLGHNGAGKSTLLRLLSGIYAPDAGHVRIEGSLGGLFELGGFGRAQLTGREYVKRTLMMHDVPRSQWAEIIAEVHRFSELGDYFDERILAYSAGMAARLYFAASTAFTRDVYLIDEALSVGDEHFQAKSWSRMRERIAGGASGVLVTHDWSAVIKLCRRACILSAGRIVEENNADIAVANYLRIPVPPADKAEIIAPDAFSAQSGAPLTLEFEVAQHTDAAVEIAVSIEFLLLGVGWEIIALSPYSALAQTTGRQRVRFTFPELLLHGGDYVVNIFAATPADALGKREVLHARSWTYGNGIKLQVSGEKGADLAPFPIRWEEAA